MCELLVGLPAVRVLGVVEDDGRLTVHVEARGGRPSCPGCEAPARVRDRPEVELVDLPVFGRRTQLVWRKHRLECVGLACPVRSSTSRSLPSPLLGSG